MDKNLALEFVRVTEEAAIAASAWFGRGDRHAADQAAVDAMRKRFNEIEFRGKIVIGEGEKDEAPKLYTGERIGVGHGAFFDVAVDPLEATDSVAWGRTNAISVIAAGPRGSILSAPDTYMEKIAVGPAAARAINLNAPVRQNVRQIARALGKKVGDVVVVVLDRPRHERLIDDIRKSGARVRLITDGDVAAAIATCVPDSGVDVLMGVGGSTEAVLAAVPLRMYGGEMLCRFAPRSESDRAAIRKSLRARSGATETTIFKARDLARGSQLLFAATGVVDGPLLKGVQLSQSNIITHSMVMRFASGTMRHITAVHRKK